MSVITGFSRRLIIGQIQQLLNLFIVQRAKPEQGLYLCFFHFRYIPAGTDPCTQF